VRAQRLHVLPEAAEGAVIARIVLPLLSIGSENVTAIGNLL